MTFDTVLGDVDREQLGRVLSDGATVADAIALWDTLENPEAMLADGVADAEEEIVVCDTCGDEYPSMDRFVDHLTDAHDAFSVRTYTRGGGGD